MEHIKTSNLPLVSAIVPAYNAEAHIEDTLHSLRSQTYANLEIIVVDDGSTDGTAERVTAMARKHPQIRMICQPSLGVAAARNRGVEESRGEFIAPVDADDIWFPEAVTKLVTCLHNSDSQVGVAYGWSVIILENGLLDGRFRCSTIQGNVFGTLICHNFMGSASATMIRRACFAKVGGYDARFRAKSAQGCEDWDLYLRIAQEYHFKVVPEFLFGYRKLRSSMSYNPAAMAKSHRYLLEKVKERHPRVPRAVYALSTSSYYLRMAYEYHFDQQPKESFQWLGRAFMSSPVFTVLRIGFYSLILKNLAAMFGSSINRLIRLPSSRLSAPIRRSPISKQTVRVKDLERKRIRIFLSIAAQSVLHRLLITATRQPESSGGFYWRSLGSWLSRLSWLEDSGRAKTARDFRSAAIPAKSRKGLRVRKRHR